MFAVVAQFQIYFSRHPMPHFHFSIYPLPGLFVINHPYLATKLSTYSPRPRYSVLTTVVSENNTETNIYDFKDIG